MEDHNKIQKAERGEHYPVIGNFIHYHIMQHNLKKADLAKALGIEPKGLTAYLKRDSLQFEVLWKLSMATKHNFLAQLGEYLPFRFESQKEAALKRELAEKDELIKQQQIQLELLQRMLGK